MDEHDEERLSQAIRQRLWTMPVGAYLDAMAVARELAPQFPGLPGPKPPLDSSPSTSRHLVRFASHLPRPLKAPQPTAGIAAARGIPISQRQTRWLATLGPQLSRAAVFVTAYKQCRSYARADQRAGRARRHRGGQRSG